MNSGCHQHHCTNTLGLESPFTLFASVPSSECAPQSSAVNFKYLHGLETLHPPHAMNSTESSHFDHFISDVVFSCAASLFQIS